jgi:predicted LPLAT superfamily acyltransferase
LERTSKTEKREFLDPRVTNITPRRHKQKTIQCTLLGDVVNIPKAPFALANILKKHIKPKLFLIKSKISSSLKILTSNCSV